jgi:hypothetical protein
LITTHIGIPVLCWCAVGSGWGQRLPNGRFRGVAVAESFKTYVTQIAEVALDRSGQPKIERVVCAVDCGVTVNPDMIRAQMEGGIGLGLGAIMKPVPGAKALVSLRIDRDVLDYFQEAGPGWQKRINEALRKAAGK